MLRTGLTGRMLRIVLFILLCVSVTIFPASMQEVAPDYSIQLIQNSFTEDNSQTIVKFDVLNSGGDADKTAIATLNLISTGEEIATATIPALVSNGRYTVVMQFSNSRFGPNSVESFRATVGVGDGADAIEIAGSASAQDNFARILITFPANLPQPETTPAAEVTIETPSQENPDNLNPLDQFLTGLNLNIDPDKPEQAALVIGLAIALVILLVIMFVIVRLIFSRKPDFGGWQPSYANLPMADPNSLPGRHQQWQQVAQNSLLPAESAEGSVFVRKLPTGVNEQYLSGWHIVAFQLSQYDRYGRVSRSQITSTPRLVNRLEWVSRRHEKLTSDQQARQLRPIARTLSRQIRKKVNERTAVLPLLMDIRLRARHGEVHIWFELYRRQAAQWLRIDRWEPDMMVTGKMIYENFTYTLFGQKPGESLKQFQKRLEEDLILVLGDFFNPTSVVAIRRPDAPTDPHMLPVTVPTEE